MKTSYRMRMYRRRTFTNRYLIGGIMWGIILYLTVLALVLFT
jgi:hypothetical protein